MSSIGSIGFTAGGIDVMQIVSSLIDVERQPILNLQSRQAAVKLQSDALGRLRSSVDGLKSQAASLIAAGGFMKLSSSVSSSGIVSASVRTGALPGSISFTVDQLARAHGLRTSGTVASSSSVITTAATLALSATAARLGVTSVTASNDVVPGKYTVEVTQATSGAVRTGSAVPTVPVTIDALTDTIDLTVNGVATSVGIAPGTYNTAAELATAVDAALSGVGVDATLDNSGRIQLTTVREGSNASLQITGGDALASLGITDLTSTTGVNGFVRIGTNPATEVFSAGDGSTVAVSAGTGTLSLTLGEGLRVGEATVAVVSTGDRSLSAVTSAINAANIGASAAAVKVTDGAWLLQLSSAGTGTDNSLVLDASSFDLAGSLIETSAARDAKITIGSGLGAYSVTASGNTFGDVLPGVTITALAESATQVTVSVARDDSAIADSVGKLVERISAVLAEINLQTKYDTVNKKAAPLTGDANVRAMAAELRAAVTALVPGGSVSLASSIGITAQRDGTLKFDKAMFLTAMQADPAGVERLFARGGTSSGAATFASATDKTIAGSYAIDVTIAATRATTGPHLVGGAPIAQVIGVRVGGVTATYEAAAGATAADIVAGLNASMAAAGLKVNAEVSGGGVELTAVAFGGAGSFETDITGAWLTATGTDVVGTIDGQAAIGIGDQLRLLDASTSTARGLAVTVTEGASGLSTVTYEPGIAARLVSLAERLTGTGGGLTTAASTYDTRIKTFGEQISRFEDRLAVKEAQMRRQWTAVQTMLSNLQSQGDWLASQVAGLPKQSS